MNIKQRIKSFLQWINCNVKNKHIWFCLGDKDLYGQDYYRCTKCQRVKYANYDQKIVDRESQKIKEGFQKTLVEQEKTLRLNRWLHAKKQVISAFDKGYNVKDIYKIVNKYFFVMNEKEIRRLINEREDSSK